MSLIISIIPCLNDNYSYICHDNSGCAFVVDPSEYKPVNEFLEKNNLNLKYILNTHHHIDHVGGNLELKNKFNAKIVGSVLDKERIPGIDLLLSDGDKFKCNDDETTIIHIAGHALGHIAYYFKEQEIVFTGDTLFSLGCGRLFEGTPEMMWNSLKKLRALPDNTNIYCGHEYTLSNAKFLDSELPSDPLDEKIKELEKFMQIGHPSIPTTIKEEKELNIFLSCDRKNLKKKLHIDNYSDIETFAYIRNLKDNF